MKELAGTQRVVFATGLFDFEGKLAQGPAQVAAALKDQPGPSLATVFVDLSVGQCNHRCTFCDGRFGPVAPAGFSTERLLALAREIRDLGAGSVLLVGDGSEPLLHPGFLPFARRLRELGLRRGLYTNGTRLAEPLFRELATFDFVRVSLNAGRPRTHRRLHGYRPGRRDYARALAFLGRLAAAGGPVAGASFLVLEENVGEIAQAARRVRDRGGHYFELKPVYGPGYSFDAIAFRRLEPELRRQLDRVRSLETAHFRVLLNRQLADVVAGRISPEMLTVTAPRPCLTSRLRLVVSPRGCYPCPPYRGDPARRFGDPAKESLTSIWYGPAHRALWQTTCKRRCPYHGQNQALLALKAGRAWRAPAPRAPLQAGFL